MSAKVSLKALTEELIKCKEELRLVMEEKERYNIENIDLKAVNSLTKIQEKETCQVKEAENVIECSICSYPFRNNRDLSGHHEKHKKIETVVNEGQICGICGTAFTTKFANGSEMEAAVSHKLSAGTDMT